jgi:hypothetical protein
VTLRQGDKAVRLDPFGAEGDTHGVRTRIWANFRTLIGISSQTAGPTCEFLANPVNFRFHA